MVVAPAQSPGFMPEVRRGRWIFMSAAPGSQTPRPSRSSKILQAIPEIGIAWHLKETFAAIYDAGDRAEAERRLAAWVEMIERLDIDEFSNVWRTLQWWREPMLNYFDDRITNAFSRASPARSR